MRRGREFLTYYAIQPLPRSRLDDNLLIDFQHKLLSQSACGVSDIIIGGFAVVWSPRVSAWKLSWNTDETQNYSTQTHTTYLNKTLIRLHTVVVNSSQFRLFALLSAHPTNFSLTENICELLFYEKTNLFSTSLIFHEYEKGLNLAAHKQHRVELSLDKFLLWWEKWLHNPLLVGYPLRLRQKASSVRGLLAIVKHANLLLIPFKRAEHRRTYWRLTQF